MPDPIVDPQHPVPATRSDHVAFRIPDSLRQRVEAVRARAGEPWRPVSLSDVMRLLVERGLEEVERRMAAEREGR